MTSPTFTPAAAPAANNVVSVNGIPTCAHTNERTSIGPTTSQINHFCPDCKQSWMTFPSLAAVEVSRLIQDARELVVGGLPKWSPTRWSIMEKLDEISLATMAPIPAPQVPSEAVRCKCKNRALTDCPGEWEPGCDLGNKAEYVRVSPTDPAVIDAAIAAPAASLVGWRGGLSAYLRNALADFASRRRPLRIDNRRARTATLRSTTDPDVPQHGRCLGALVGAGATRAAPTDAPGAPDMRLRNLQTWLVCRELGREIGSALAPSLETVQGWMAALGDVTGEAPPDFIMKASKRDNSRCKFAAGGACCSSHCGDPACLASAPPTAADAQGVGEAPEAVANDYARIGLLEWAVERWRSSVQNRPLVNVHRRTMDDCWRSVMRYAGGDPEALVGPSHDELLSADPTASTTARLTEAAREVITARDNYGWSTEADEKIEALRVRIAAHAEPRVSTSGYLQTVPPSPPTTLHWDDAPAAAAGPTDEQIQALWNRSTGVSYKLAPISFEFARAVWDAASSARPSTDHLLATGAEQEHRYATMIGEISDALGLTETEQFEADGADKILASIAALRATAAVPAVEHAWRVGEFVSSARPLERVLMLAVGRRQIGEYGMHRDFVRWIATSASAPQVDKSADLHGGPVDEIAETHGEVVDDEFTGAPTVAEGSSGWACARDSGSRCKTHCGLTMCMQADQSGLSPADAARKPSYGIDGPHDGTDHHQIWKRAQRQEVDHD